MLKVGINGFGRIGRMAMRVSMNQNKVKVVAVNDLADNSTLAHLLKYDSVYGVLDLDIKADDQGFDINGERIAVFSEREPAKIPWKDYEVDLVIESTGIFRTRQTASAHLNAGAERVIITAPGEADIVMVLGVNDHLYDPEKHYLISNASCTTNALAPLAKVLHENFGIKKGLMNTTHAYTNDQNLLDFPHSDLRRARAAALSVIPTSTGAAKTVGEVMPELKGRIDGLAIRVPTPTVSLVDFVAELEKEATVDEINAALKKEADGSDYFAFSDLPLVSVDYKGDPHSATVDGMSTMVIGGNMARVLAWYDNEWAYSCRVIDLAALIASK
ncbi:MAG: type I glyceraldehyde-3-phosphate dehydrogenase [Bacillota bacterium]|nr:type I glyceraldehyde-3-phosphate dehydrogenase [Bacillota bacterium]MDW7728990.1 type I glyceraldehyde-3-phosphate dehydrogenase [Bacillota bacterium]